MLACGFSFRLNNTTRGSGLPRASGRSFELVQAEDLIAWKSRADLSDRWQFASGLRAGEVEALRWEQGRGHFTSARTEKSAAPVPVIASLAHALEEHRRTNGGVKEGLVFRSRVLTPLNLQHLSERGAFPSLEG
jgi:integrase